MRRRILGLFEWRKRKREWRLVIDLSFSDMTVRRISRTHLITGSITLFGKTYRGVFIPGYLDTETKRITWPAKWMAPTRAEGARA